MITSEEIKAECEKWWNDVLLSSISSNAYFPKEINRIGRIRSKDILENLSNYTIAIQDLKKGSKEVEELSYTVIFEEQAFDKIGRQKVPKRIVVESLDDYLGLTRREKEYKIFRKNYALIKQELPILIDWINLHVEELIKHNTWADTIKVCKYFINTPRPGLYVRQLPIDIHTKYIIENERIIRLLLEFLIPDYINTQEKRFEGRFNLKYAEPLIRIRFLDKQLSPIKSVSDISLTLSEFSNSRNACQNIIVTENVMNFLTLPYLQNTIAIWSGGGFKVSFLKNVDWLRSKYFFYWGDIDAHGFQILNQVRTYFPNTMSVMMNRETLDSFKPKDGEPASKQNLALLSIEESELYDYVRENNIRLEQEKINQTFVESQLSKLFGRIEN